MVKFTKYEGIKNELFTSKEHYLAFRQAWKDSHKEHPYQFSATDFMLFSLLTETDLNKSFKPSPRGKEYKNGFDGPYAWIRNHGFNASKLVAWELGTRSKPSHMTEEKFKAYTEKEYEYLEKFLKPYGGTVSITMLARLYDEYLVDKKLTNDVDELKEAA